MFTGSAASEKAEAASHQAALQQKIALLSSELEAERAAAGHRLAEAGRQLEASQQRVQELLAALEAERAATAEVQLQVEEDLSRTEAASLARQQLMAEAGQELSRKLSLAEAHFEAASEAFAIKSLESAQALEAVQAVQVEALALQVTESSRERQRDVGRLQAAVAVAEAGMLASSSALTSALRQRDELQGCVERLRAEQAEQALLDQARHCEMQQRVLGLDSELEVAQGRLAMEQAAMASLQGSSALQLSCFQDAIAALELQLASAKQHSVSVTETITGIHLFCFCSVLLTSCPACSCLFSTVTALICCCFT